VSRQSKFPDVNAAVGFVRTSAGLAKYRSSWIESIGRWTLRLQTDIQKRDNFKGIFWVSTA